MHILLFHLQYKKEMESFNKENFLIKIMKDLEKNIMYIKMIILSLQSHHLQDMPMKFGLCQKNKKLALGFLMINK